MFSTPIPAISYVMLALCLASIITAIFYGLKAYYKVLTLSNQPLPESSENLPKVSVIVYADCSEELLDGTLEQIVMEDYTNFEIVVVCDSLGEYAGILKEKYAAKYDNVYVTFIPQGSHNLSRKKLALTTGIKAATGEIIVTTIGNIQLSDSGKWLSSIIAPFCENTGNKTDIVLGLSRINFEDFRGISRWYRQFDNIIDCALWIGYSALGRPFRGDGYNLAFRRSVFLNNKGYAKTVNIHTGDDDLFISEIATSTNTRAVVYPESIITSLWPDGANRIWSNRKEGYIFTSKWLNKSPFVRAWINDALQWFVVGTAVTGLITALPNLIGLIIGVSLILIFWIIETLLYVRLSKIMKGEKIWYLAVPFWLFRIPIQIYFRLKHYRHSKQNFTWERIS